jgi:hypothetical protein
MTDEAKLLELQAADATLVQSQGLPTDSGLGTYDRVKSLEQLGYEEHVKRNPDAYTHGHWVIWKDRKELKTFASSKELGDCLKTLKPPYFCIQHQTIARRITVDGVLLDRLQQKLVEMDQQLNTLQDLVESELPQFKTIQALLERKWPQKGVDQLAYEAHIAKTPNAYPDGHWVVWRKEKEVGHVKNTEQLARLLKVLKEPFFCGQYFREPQPLPRIGEVGAVDK